MKNDTNVVEKEKKEPPETEPIDIKALEEFSERSIALSSVDEVREHLASFVKGMLDGHVNTRVLSFADVIENDRYHALQARCDKIRELLQEKKDLVDAIDVEEKISKDILLPLRNLGAYGLQCDKTLGGQGLSMTETMKVLEEFSVNMSLSEAMAIPNTVGLMPIVKFGSEGAKAKYLPKLASGEWNAAFCVSEEEAGVDPQQCSCIAEVDPETSEVIVTGKKCYVSNAANSDVFVVFAQDTGSRVSREHQLGYVSAVVVEKNMPGVTVVPSQENRVGLRALSVADLTFDGVRVPLENVLLGVGEGQEVFADGVLRERAFAGARTSAALRNLLSETVQHCLRRKAFGLPVSEFELVTDRLARMSAAVYALESMTYLTAGIADVQREPDLYMEANITKYFATQVARQVLDGCVALFGSRAYMAGHLSERLQRDLEALELWEGTSDIVLGMIAELALAHVHTQRHEEYSTPWKRLAARSPIQIAMRFHWLFCQKRDRFSLKDKISPDVHPSLKQPADILEYCVWRLTYAVECIYEMYNFEERMKQVDLRRLADMATSCYALAATLARANRSYCHGHRHNDEELEVCQLVAMETLAKVRRLTRTISLGYAENNDFILDEIADRLLKNGEYKVRHPIKD